MKQQLLLPKTQWAVQHLRVAEVVQWGLQVTVLYTHVLAAVGSTQDDERHTFMKQPMPSHEAGAV